jgi:hypothetical protein
MALNEEQNAYAPPQSARRQASILPLTPLSRMEHLLKVASSVTQDANQVWSEIWNELKRCTGRNGDGEAATLKGFVPSCGWPEFLEKLWLLKHYLDSIHRICNQQREQ